MKHPYRAALVAFIVGVVSFVVAAVTPYMENTSNYAKTPDKLAWWTATATWLIIPAIALILTISFLSYGLSTHNRRKVTR
jgi:uncharacterized membrane protein YdcZ (DUF606 family)